jgi:hypothetical protein
VRDKALLGRLAVVLQQMDSSVFSSSEAVQEVSVILNAYANAQMNDLALVLSQQKGEPASMALLMSAQFDTGFFRSIRFVPAGGGTGFERRAQAEPGVVVVRLQLGEKTADDDAAVGLKREGRDVTVGAGVELEIEGSIGVEAGEIDAVDAVGGAIRQDGGKRTADDDLAIALGDGGEDGAVEVGVEPVVGRGSLAEESGGGYNQEGTRADERADAGAEGQ